MKIVDYVKIEELKRLVVYQLRQLGMLEETQTINERDLNTILTAMAQLHGELGKKEEFNDKMDYLIAYIIGLWGRLVIDYGADIKEL
jgi:hypothetical protein